MTVSELAEHLLVSHTTIYRLLRNSHLPFFKVGGAYRFDRDEIDEWAAHRKVKTANSATRISNDAITEPRSAKSGQ